MTNDDDITAEDVMNLLSNIRTRDVQDVRTPTGGAFQIEFEVDDLDGKRYGKFDGGRYLMEFSIPKGNMWLHDYDGETETIWSSTSRY